MQKTSFPGLSRRGSIALEIGDTAYIGLGFNGSSTYYDVYAYSSQSDTWTQVTNYPGSGGRVSFGATVNGKGYVGGGEVGSGSVKRDFWEFNPSTSTWTSLGNFPFGNRSHGIAESVNGKLYLGLGHNGVSNFNDFWEYNPRTNTWTQMASFPGTGRINAMSFMVDNKIIVGGGFFYGTGSGFSDYYQYDPSTNSWSTVVGFSGAGRSTSASFVIDDRGYLSSGWNSTKNAIVDTWEYDAINNRILDSILCQGDTFHYDSKRTNASFLWHDLSTDSTRTFTQAGTYWVDISFVGCPYTDTIHISNFLSIDIGADTTICQGNNLNLDVTQAGASYLWQDNSTSSTYTIQQSGLYWVEVDLNGCKERDSIQVTFQSNPIVDLGPDTTICQGNDLRLDVTQSGASYLWQDNSTSSTFTVQQSGLYWVEVDINGCMARDSIRVDFENYPIVNLGKDTILCTGSTLNLNVNNTGATYLWQDNSTSSSFTVQQSGLYWVEVDINECKERDSIQVVYQLSPIVDLGPDTSICQGNDLRLDATQSGASYLWQDNSTSSAFTVQQSGLYWVEVDLNGCVKRDSIQVAFQSNPKVDLGADTTICQGSNLTLDATQVSASYLWQDNSSNPTYTVQQAGLYWVEVDLNGCVDRDSIIISLKTPPKVNLGNDTSVCQADFWLDATTTNGSYIWHDNSTQATFHVTQTGLYWVEVVVNGCKARDSILVSSASPPTISLGDDKSLCIGETIWLNPFFNSLGKITWQDSIVANQLAVSDSGSYWVELKNDCGTASDTVNVITEDCDCRVFIPNAFSPNSDYLNELFKPKVNCEFNSYRFIIFNRWGEQVFETAVHGQGWDGTVNGQNSPQGSYIYRLEYSNKVVVDKVLVGTFTLIR